MKIIIGYSEGTAKKGIELYLDELLTSIKNEYGGSFDEWEENAFLDLQMDMVIIE